MPAALFTEVDICWAVTVILVFICSFDGGFLFGVNFGFKYSIVMVPAELYLRLVSPGKRWTTLQHYSYLLRWSNHLVTDGPAALVIWQGYFIMFLHKGVDDGFDPSVLFELYDTEEAASASSPLISLTLQCVNQVTAV